MSTNVWSDSAARSKPTAKVTDLPLYRVLRMLGSLKITVTMFGLGILLLFFGTLAQDELNMAEVKRLYFNSWLAVVPFDVLAPITIFPHSERIPFAIPFPGGATIGVIMMINLIAAKVTRFAVFTKGTQLTAGIAISLLGALLLVAVIISGHSSNGLQGRPPIEYATLWKLLRIGFAIITVAMVIYVCRPVKMPLLYRIALGFAAGTLGVLTAFMNLEFLGGTAAKLDDPSLRIVWQLLQSGIASAVCLTGLIMIFGRRGGNVLIHAGVGLLMVGQFVFGDRQVEQRMSIVEGESTSLTFRQDELELAIIDTTSNKEEDAVTAIPEALLRWAVRTGKTIESDELPFRLKIVKWMSNSSLTNKIEENNLATIGQAGLQFSAIEKQQLGGAMEGTNIAAAYIQIFPKGKGEAVGTILLTQELNDQGQLFFGVEGDRNERITVEEKDYELGLHFRREYKPYLVTLKDVIRTDYSGSETPRDYASELKISDKSDQTKSLQGKTWMNNPLRYRGETFYQSQYNKVPMRNGDTVEVTGLQVVENAGWVIPYVCCMMVLVGMISHFGGTFLTFAFRFERGVFGSKDSAASETSEKVPADQKNYVMSYALPAVLGLGFVAIMATYFALPQKPSRTEVNWTAIGQIPMQHAGRIKPFETVAKNVLQETYEPVFGSVPNVKDSKDQKYTPTQWLAHLIADNDAAADARVFRIYSKEVRDIFQLDEDRPRFLYSYNELQVHRPEFQQKISPLRDKKSAEFTPEEQKLATISHKLSAYELVFYAYQVPPLPKPVEADDSDEARRNFSAQLMQNLDFIQRIEADHPPSIIPPVGEVDEKNPEANRWQAYGPSVFTALVTRMMTQQPTNPALISFTDLVEALRAGKPQDINKAVANYGKTLEDMPAAAQSDQKVKLEVWFNKFAATNQGILCYLLAILLGFGSFIVAMMSPKGGNLLRRATFWLLVGTLVIHTVAIVSRIYISGRPPVINLYSSAIFIGWGGVIIGLVLESIFSLGICNLAAAVFGLVTLSIARSLDNNDTMHVLQAVLDTQFWLATHVVTVTLGYSATYFAGFLGAAALIHRVLSGIDKQKPDVQSQQHDKDIQKVLYISSYGVVCFALLLSFIGTVLGGLWADDSWGRFWGWDPKENGALMIVLWNAIILHARWDKLVSQRGFAILTVIGNIVTTWSWFGVNQLGVGLHSYGENSSVLAMLGITILLHILFIAGTLFLTQLQKKTSTSPTST